MGAEGLKKASQDAVLNANYLKKMLKDTLPPVFSKTCMHEVLLDGSLLPIKILDLAKRMIDFNVHPSKTEVKFDDENIIYAIILSTIKHSLGKYNVVPNIDFSNNINMSIPSETKVSAPTIEVDYGFTPFKVSDKNSNSNINEFFVENKRESIFSENDVELISEYPVFDFSNKFLITKSKTDLLIINIKRAF